MTLVIEHDVEARLKKRVKECGGWCIKFASASETGIPDRIVVLPKGRVAFAELKRPKGGRLEPIQEYQIEKLKKLGCSVRVIRNYDDIESFLKELLGEDYHERT